MKTLKSKLIIGNVLLIVVILLLVGTTLAYFTDKAQVTNTMTSGNVKIALTEAAVKRDDKGNLVEDTSKMRFMGTEQQAVNNYGEVYPGQTIFKDPTVKNISSASAWVAAKVVLNDGAGDIHKLIGYLDNENLDIEMLLSGGLLEEQVHVGTWNGVDKVCYNDRYAMVQVPNPQDDEYAFYFFFNKAFEKDETALLFDTVTIDEWWNNSEMQQLKELEIKVQAYAVQTTGFETCLDAMKTAFPTHFDF